MQPIDESRLAYFYEEIWRGLPNAPTSRTERVCYVWRALCKQQPSWMQGLSMEKLASFRFSSYEEIYALRVLQKGEYAPFSVRVLQRICQVMRKIDQEEKVYAYLQKVPSLGVLFSCDVIPEVQVELVRRFHLDPTTTIYDFVRKDLLPQELVEACRRFYAPCSLQDSPFVSFRETDVWAHLERLATQSQRSSWLRENGDIVTLEQLFSIASVASKVSDLVQREILRRVKESPSCVLKDAITPCLYKRASIREQTAAVLDVCRDLAQEKASVVFDAITFAQASRILSLFSPRSKEEIVGLEYVAQGLQARGKEELFSYFFQPFRRVFKRDREVGIRFFLRCSALQQKQLVEWLKDKERQDLLCALAATSLPLGKLCMQHLLSSSCACPFIPKKHALSSCYYEAFAKGNNLYTVVDEISYNNWSGWFDERRLDDSFYSRLFQKMQIDIPETSYHVFELEKKRYVGERLMQYVMQQHLIRVKADIEAIHSSSALDRRCLQELSALQEALEDMQTNGALEGEDLYLLGKYIEWLGFLMQLRHLIVVDQWSSPLCSKLVKMVCNSSQKPEDVLPEVKDLLRKSSSGKKADACVLSLLLSMYSQCFFTRLETPPFFLRFDLTKAQLPILYEYMYVRRGAGWHEPNSVITNFLYQQEEIMLLVESLLLQYPHLAGIRALLLQKVRDCQYEQIEALCAELGGISAMPALLDVDLIVHSLYRAILQEYPQASIEIESMFQKRMFVHLYFIHRAHYVSDRLRQYQVPESITDYIVRSLFTYDQQALQLGIALLAYKRVEEIEDPILQGLLEDLSMVENVQEKRKLLQERVESTEGFRDKNYILQILMHPDGS